MVCTVEPNGGLVLPVGMSVCFCGQGGDRGGGSGNAGACMLITMIMKVLPWYHVGMIVITAPRWSW